MSTASLKPLHTPVQPRGKQPTRGDGGHGRGRPWGQAMGAGQPGPCAPPQPQVLLRSAGGLAPWGSSQEQFLVLAAAPLLKRDKKWVLKGDAVMPMLRLCSPAQSSGTLIPALQTASATAWPLQLSPLGWWLHRPSLSIEGKKPPPCENGDQEQQVWAVARGRQRHLPRTGYSILCLPEDKPGPSYRGTLSLPQVLTCHKGLGAQKALK